MVPWHVPLRRFRWEAYTPLAPGTTLDDMNVDRDLDGRIMYVGSVPDAVWWGMGLWLTHGGPRCRYGWKKGTPPVFQAGQQTLIDAGDMHLHESAIRIRDAKSVACVQPNLFRGSVHWNAFRQRYIMISGEFFGEGSVDGEVWCADPTACVAGCTKCPPRWVRVTRVV